MSYNPSGGGSSSIAGSTDVALNNPANAQVLVYNSTLSKWQNQATSSVISASTQTASYTLVLGDAGTVVEMNSASILTVTVPPNSSVAFPVGTIIEILQVGSGAINITGGAGVTVNSPATLQTRGQWSSLGLRKRATDTWLLSGDLA